MAGARGPAAIVRALEWGAPEAASTVQALAAADLELIVAADVCYVDQARAKTKKRKYTCGGVIMIDNSTHRMV